MKKFIITLMAIFIIVGEFTVINFILELLKLADNMYVTYIIFIGMILLNIYMFKTLEEDIKKGST